MAIEEKDIVVALRKPKLSEYGKDHLLTLVDGLIHKTHINCGYKADKEIINQYIDELVSDLVKYNGLLSFQEIEIAFKNGWKGEYGEFMGLNNKTFSTWVTAYRFGVKRANAKIAMQKAKEIELTPVVISEKEKESIIREGALSCFKSFYETKVLTDYGNITYNYLDKLGKIPFTAERKREIMAQCKERLLAEEKEKFASVAFELRNPIKKEIENIIADKSAKLIFESKREALKQYFIQLIEMDEELDNLI